jgi:hypothetical protein
MLIDRGFTDRLLVSQDVCAKIDLRHDGGNGYDHGIAHWISYAARVRSYGPGGSQNTTRLSTTAKRCRS